MEVNGTVTGQSLMEDRSRKMIRTVVAMENGSAFYMDGPKGEFGLDDKVTVTVEKISQP